MLRGAQGQACKTPGWESVSAVHSLCVSKKMLRIVANRVGKLLECFLGQKAARLPAEFSLADLKPRAVGQHESPV